MLNGRIYVKVSYKLCSMLVSLNKIIFSQMRLQQNKKVIELSKFANLKTFIYDTPWLSFNFVDIETGYCCDCALNSSPFL